MRIFLIAVMMIAFAGSALAGDKIERLRAAAMESFTPDTVKWHDEPILPKGAQSAVLVGDPNKAGVFVAWLKFPPDYPIPPHTHPFTEVITILRGTLGNGIGETFDRNKDGMLKAGSGFVLPADHPHYVWTTDEETIIELIATGPWDIVYTNPADDPRNKK